MARETTPTRTREEFSLYLSPSPAKCTHSTQFDRLENKLDKIIAKLETPPVQATPISSPVRVPSPVITAPLLPPQQPGPSRLSNPLHSNNSSILSEHDSFLDDLCSILSGDDIGHAVNDCSATVSCNQTGQFQLQPTFAQPSAQTNYVQPTLFQPPQQVHVVQPTVVQTALQSPERVMTRFSGRDEKSLRALAVHLARDCVFGTAVMAQSSRSGRGENVQQLDPTKLDYIKNIIAGRVGRNILEPEFELIWEKCLISIGKACQMLRNKAKKGL